MSIILKSFLSADPTDPTYAWENARGSIKQAYRKVQERADMKRYRIARKKDRFGKKIPVQKRF